MSENHHEQYKMCSFVECVGFASSKSIWKLDTGSWLSGRSLNTDSESLLKLSTYIDSCRREWKIHQNDCCNYGGNNSVRRIATFFCIVRMPKCPIQFWFGEVRMRKAFLIYPGDQFWEPFLAQGELSLITKNGFHK